MKYGSVCSGIEAASVAWHPLGWEPQWYSEIEHFPSEVLKHRFPNTPNLGDMTKLTSNPIFNEKSINLLVGGTPCQSFSVAGLRGGLADPRGNLMLTFLALADAKKPKWIVWENVPGVLSSNGGKDFGTFLTALGNIGYGFAYRVLDAQFFGVAQRRRRVFVIGYLGDWRPAAAVLFESESLSRDTKPSRKKGKETPTDAKGGVGSSGKSWWDGGQTAATLTKQNANGAQRMPDKDNFGAVIEPQYFDNHAQDSRVTGPHDVGSTVSANYGMGGGNTPIVGQPTAQPVHAFKVRGGCEGGGKGYLGEDEKAFTLSATQDQQIAQPIAYSFDSLSSNSMKSSNPHSGCREVDTSKTIDTTIPEPSKNQGGIAIAQPVAVDTPTIIDRAAFNQGENAQYEPRIEQGQTMSSLVAKGPHAVQHTMAIRRLTPKECERLQGFPDDWTRIPYRNKPADQCPDGPRYKACGNSMAVPVMRWIGERIQKIENLLNEK